MLISIITLFPEMFSGPFTFSIIKRAQTQNLVRISLINLRDFATDKYRTVDDKPYGGGTGMILKVDVIYRALIFTESYSNTGSTKTLKSRRVLLDPKGSELTQKTAVNLSRYKHLILICGHYEGVDARVDQMVDQKISIGKYILTGGEIPAMVLADTITRLIPGVLKKQTTIDESHNTSQLEYPQFTKPQVFQKMRVPKVLVSGNHQQIEKWKQAHRGKKG